MLSSAFAHCTVSLMLQVPVAEGSHVTFIGLPKTWVADFVHGSDGFGNMASNPPIQVGLSILTCSCSGGYCMNLALSK